MSIEKKIKQLNSEDYTILTNEGKKYPIPEEGSLGLFALGYRGIMAWKIVKKESKNPNS